MENISSVVKWDDPMELPPGFRFHPSDEELITHYLTKKVLDYNFYCAAIGEVDMNKVEPWELPWRAKLGEKEWYFFSVKDKKYPTGLRTNRATAAGYWKATGKDKEILRGKTLVGMKKTLVFYKGRAPKGEKSNWVTHEYRLEGKLSNDHFTKPTKNDWVISRVFQKTVGGKKVHISGLMRTNSEGIELPPLPPLMDPSPVEPETSHVHCFSNPIVAPRQSDQNMTTCFTDPIFPPSFNPLSSFATSLTPTQLQFPQFHGGIGFQFLNSIPMQDPSIVFRNLMGNYGHNLNHAFRKHREMVSLSKETSMGTENSSVVSNLEMGKRSFEEQEAPSTTIGADDLDLMWDY